MQRNIHAYIQVLDMVAEFGKDQDSVIKFVLEPHFHTYMHAYIHTYTGS